MYPLYGYDNSDVMASMFKFNAMDSVARSFMSAPMFLWGTLSSPLLNWGGGFNFGGCDFGDFSKSSGFMDMDTFHKNFSKYGFENTWNTGNDEDDDDEDNDSKRHNKKEAGMDSLTNAQKENYKKFKNFLDKLTKTDDGKKYQGELKDALAVAKEAENYDDKMKALQDFYDSIDNEVKETFFEEKYKTNLDDMAYQGKYIDGENGMLKYIRTYRSKSKDDRSHAPFNQIIPPTYDDTILGFIGAWNTAEGNHNLITELVNIELKDKKDEVCNTGNGDENGNGQGTISGFIEDIVSSLLTKANNPKGKYKTDIEKAVTNLTATMKIYRDTKQKAVETADGRHWWNKGDLKDEDITNIKKASENVNTAFNELYRLLRLQELQKFSNSFEADYGFLKEDYAKNIKKATENDLRGEGFTDGGVAPLTGGDAGGNVGERHDDNPNGDLIGPLPAVPSDEGIELGDSGSSDETGNNTITKDNISQFVGENKPFKLATASQLEEINNKLGDNKVDKAYIMQCGENKGEAYGFNATGEFITLGYKVTI